MSSHRRSHRHHHFPRHRRHLCCAVTVLAVLAAACGGRQPVVEEKLRPVRTETVVATGARRVRTFTGTARAGIESRLSFRVPGTVAQLVVSVGDSVRQTDLIARLDAQDYRLQVQEAEASLTQADAARRNAQAEYNRVRELYENDSASKSQLDQARAASESAAAQVESIRKRLELARRQLSYTRLTAPVAGAIASVAVEVNENVQAGQTVVILTSGSRPEVEVAIPGTLIAEVAEGDQVEVSFDALPGQVLAAVVTEVGVAAGGTTTFPVTVRLQHAGSQVRPGMAAEVAFRFGTEGGEPRYFVPPVAVGEDRNGRFVFLAETQDDGTAVVRRRPVTVGDLTPEGLEIREGLSDGDLLITAGVRRLEEGRQVRLMEHSS